MVFRKSSTSSKSIALKWEQRGWGLALLYWDILGEQRDKTRYRKLTVRQISFCVVMLSSAWSASFPRTFCEGKENRSINLIAMRKNILAWTLLQKYSECGLGNSLATTTVCWSKYDATPHSCNEAFFPDSSLLWPNFSPLFVLVVQSVLSLLARCHFSFRSRRTLRARQTNTRYPLCHRGWVRVS